MNKTIFLGLSLLLSSLVFGIEPYKVTEKPWGKYVTLQGITGDLFAEYELKNSRGPKWRGDAETFIEDETDALEVAGKIEDADILDDDIDYDDVDYIMPDYLNYEWRAMKPVRKKGAKTILYVVDVYGSYIVNMRDGTSFETTHHISEVVFLNKKSEGSAFTYLGKRE